MFDFTNNIRTSHKCLKCNRPIGNESWRTYCTYCYAKVSGKIVKCSNCPKRLPIFPKQYKKKIIVLIVTENGMAIKVNALFVILPFIICR